MLIYIQSCCVGKSVDIDSNSKDIVFELGSIMEFLNISITNDNLVEPTENFTLSIQIPPESIGIGIFLGTTAVVTGYITDDDGMVILMIYVQFYAWSMHVMWNVT